MPSSLAAAGKALWRIVALGLPMGLFPAADLIGLAMFQLMQVGLGAVAGAATQIVMMMTSIAYMPAVGIAIAGTTLVGQSIGAGDRQLGRQGRQRIDPAQRGVYGYCEHRARA